MTTAPTTRRSAVMTHRTMRIVRRSSPAAAVFTALALAASATPQAQTVANAEAPPPTAAGQTATQLADGQWLVLGSQGPAEIVRGPGVRSSLRGTLSRARTGHSATVLPDGRVLVHGGVDASGSIVAPAEIFDPATQAFQPSPSDAAIPRAYHSASVLHDGRVLIAGGVDDRGQPVHDLELWDLVTGNVAVLDARLAGARRGHQAAVLPDGKVLLWGGLGNDGHAVETAEVIDTETGALRSLSAADALRARQLDDAQPPAVRDSLPAPEARDIAGERPLIVRFTKPMSVASLSARSVTLIGPAGAEPVKVVPVERGVMMFVWPAHELLPASRYTLFVSGAVDLRAEPLPLAAIGFDTAAKQPGQRFAGAPSAPQAITALSPLNDQDDWVPGPQHLTGRWRADRAASSLEALPPLRAPAGATALSGQVLGLSGRAVPGVTLRIRDREVRTDATGRFLLSELEPGFAKLEIDGASADQPGTRYGYYAARIEIKPRVTTVVPYVIWMPRLDPAGDVRIAAPTTAETIVSSPSIPGLELHIPPGTVIRDRQGRVVTELNLTAIPVDRPPFPVPDLGVPVYFTIQPGGAVIESVTGKPSDGARLFYPNFNGEVAGAKGAFWNYDPDAREWFVYGLGTVASDAKQVVPDDGVVIHELTGAMFNGHDAPPPAGNPPCAANTCCSADGLDSGTGDGGDGGTCSFGGDPVSLFTGQFVHVEHDITVDDVMPIDITRTYNSADKNLRSFGIGMVDAYNTMLYSQNGFLEVDLIMPSGTRVHYVRTSPGTDSADAAFETTDPGVWEHSVITRNLVRLGWDLKFRDGRNWYFQQLQPLLEMRDINGNVVRIIRQDTNGTSGKIARIVSQNGRTLDFSYNAAGLVGAITDQIGRSVVYHYDTGKRLTEVIDPMGGVTSYTWDTVNNRITAIHDRNGNLVVASEYDGNSRVKKQTLADGSTYRYDYTVVNGVVTKTDLTDQRGTIRRVELNAIGNIVRNTYAVGQPEEQATSYEITDGQLVASVDPLGRRTAYEYNASGDTTQVTRMAGTGEASSTAVTYDSVFHQPLTITDANGNTTTMTYDDKGNLLTVRDALGHTASFTYDSQGRLKTRTDALGKVSTLSYEGADLASATDPLGRQSQYITDFAGRMIAAIDPMGNRTLYDWDDLDRAITTTDALGAVTSVTYDANDNVHTQVDAAGNARTFSYNALNRVERTRDARGRESTALYDVDGQIKQLIDRNGQLSAISYDALGRVKTMAFGATSSHPTAYASVIENTWDAGNRLTQVIDKTCADPVASLGCSSVAATRVITRSYDGLDRMTSELTPHGEVDYTYDPAGRRTTMTVKNGPPGAQVSQPTTTYHYDAANRPTAIDQAAGPINGGQAQHIAFAYDAAGRRTQTTLANGSTVGYAYDDAGQVTSIVYTKADGTSIGDLQYKYDANGRKVAAGGSLARLDLPQVDVTDATYDANDRLVTWAGKTYTYDDNGNLISDGSRTYQWSERNQLKVIRDDARELASFVYDSSGRRIGKTIAGATTGFVHDGANIVQELLGTANTSGVKAHLVTGGIDEVFLRAEGSDGSSLRSVLADASNHTIMLLDTAQASVASYSYEPYGATVSDGDSSNTQQFTGRENDNPGNEEGLYYYRARYYMPGIARFISEDPIGWASGQTNRYAYVGGDPINFIDPSGLDASEGEGAGGGPRGGRPKTVKHPKKPKRPKTPTAPSAPPAPQGPMQGPPTPEPLCSGEYYACTDCCDTYLDACAGVGHVGHQVRCVMELSSTLRGCRADCRSQSGVPIGPPTPNFIKRVCVTPDGVRFDDECKD